MHSNCFNVLIVVKVKESKGDTLERNNSAAGISDVEVKSCVGEVEHEAYRVMRGSCAVCTCSCAPVHMCLHKSK